KSGEATRYVGQPTTYQLTVSNTGTAPLRSVVLTDPVSAHMSFISATDGGRFVNNQVQWPVGALEPGASRSVQVVLRAEAAGRMCDRAAAAAERGLTAPAAACTDFVGVSALLLEVVDTADPVAVDGET